MSTSTRRRARHKTAPEPATGPIKKCTLCQNTDEEALEDFGEQQEYDLPYWMCAEVGPCIDRVWAARASAAEPEATDAADETAEVAK
jgi:hypothetical protein